MPIEELEPEGAARVLACLMKGAACTTNPACRGTPAKLIAELPWLLDALGERFESPDAPGTWSWHTHSPHLPDVGILNPERQALILGFGLKPDALTHLASVTADGPHANLFGPGGRLPVAAVILQAGKPATWDDPSGLPDRMVGMSLVLNVPATGLPGMGLVAIQFGTRIVSQERFGLDTSAYCLVQALQAGEFPASYWSPATDNPVILKWLRRHCPELREFLAHRTRLAG